MTADSVLQILPNRGLDQSILLAILVGMLILLVFTETLGWVFVGLVVPGYLASVFVIQPSVGIAITFEAVITYVLVRFLSDILAKTTIWSPFFGRERFFMIVLVSIVVRQNSQIWLLPALLGFIDKTLGTNLQFDVTEFTSIGLVLVPLVANMFWKINLRRGFYQIGIPVLLTYLLLVFVLLPYTNLSFSNIEITYDNVALNFLSTPKAYVIMLVGAILAARFNVLYGWDYNGILVPSLLALGWLEPQSIAITIVEVLVLFGTTKLVLASPMLRTANLEGPRQIIIVFTLSFTLKYILAWVVGSYWAHVNVIDLFGFGYVITSLLVVKMLQKKVIGRVLLPSLHVSLIAFVCGSLVGFGLEEVFPKSARQAQVARVQPIPSNTLLRSPLGAMAMAEIRARAIPLPQHVEGRSKAVLEQYGALWQALDGWLSDEQSGDQRSSEKSQQRQRAIEDAAASLGLEFRLLARSAAGGRRAYVLAEAEERLQRQSGWDTAVLIPGAPGPVIEIPRPRTEPAVAELAAVLCEHLQCRAIVASGIDSNDGGRTSGDALAHPRSTFAIAVDQLRSAPSLQLRTSTRMPHYTARVHLHHKLPEQVRLDRLWPASLGINVELEWSPPPGPNRLWQTRNDRIVIVVHPDALWDVLREHALKRGATPSSHQGVAIKPWLRQTFDEPHAIGVSQTLPSQSEIRFFGHLVASRLLTMQTDRLPWLNYLAGLVDYEIVELPQCIDDAGCWLLTEQARPTRHRWGTLAVRADLPIEPWAVEAPRPLIENGTWQIAVEMWKQLHARALIVGHDVPATHGIPRLDPVRFGNVATPFHAMHESVHRALQDNAKVAADPIIVQVRGFASWRPISKHAVVGLGPPALMPRQIPPALERMLAPGGFLGWLREDVDFARGDPEYITMAGQGNPQLSFTRSTGGVNMVLIWFSQPVRELFMDESIESSAQRIESAGFAITSRSALAFLTEPPPPRPSGKATMNKAIMEFDSLINLAERYAITQDIAIVRRLRDLADKDPRVAVSASWSTEISIPFLAITVDGPDELRRAVVLLSKFADVCNETSDHPSPSRHALRAALIQRCRTTIIRHPRPAP